MDFISGMKRRRDSEGPDIQPTKRRGQGLLSPSTAQSVNGPSFGLLPTAVTVAEESNMTGVAGIDNMNHSEDMSSMTKSASFRPIKLPKGFESDVETSSVHGNTGERNVEFAACNEQRGEPLSGDWSRKDSQKHFPYQSRKRNASPDLHVTENKRRKGLCPSSSTGYD
ncbi:hypothetical protein ACHAPU_007226 [Fusarium lateritium]